MSICELNCIIDVNEIQFNHQDTGDPDPDPDASLTRPPSEIVGASYF